MPYRKGCFLANKKKKIVKAQGESGFLMSFAGGLICTLLLVVAVPIVCDILIKPVVVDLIGDTAIASLSSGTIVTIVMFIVWVIFSMVFGGSAIFKRFGVIGVIALIAAYWLLGRLMDAVIPVAVIIIMIIWSYHKGKK
ncbi:MAG: hypothetical protein IIZ24_01225 [Candidatus Methanomethylophilus sp.]|jgi:hypothetical protein|nr:hypothetical protein [Methanomethylophilus sp.]MBQ5397307.1 hypothetical protein [Methanomethylophilus sp.]MBQ5448054.1 hypothetical protein [Methanomethylophilus sp.]